MGAQKSGAAGFFQGLGQGVVGVVTQPMSGMMDFVAKAAEGAGASIDQTLKNMTVRLPCPPPKLSGVSILGRAKGRQHASSLKIPPPFLEFFISLFFLPLFLISPTLFLLPPPSPSHFGSFSFASTFSCRVTASTDPYVFFSTRATS
jgi:hypothetical protein